MIRIDKNSIKIEFASASGFFFIFSVNEMFIPDIFYFRKFHVIFVHEREKQFKLENVIIALLTTVLHDLSHNKPCDFRDRFLKNLIANITFDCFLMTSHITNMLI